MFSGSPIISKAVTPVVPHLLHEAPPAGLAEGPVLLVEHDLVAQLLGHLDDLAVDGGRAVEVDPQDARACGVGVLALEPAVAGRRERVHRVGHRLDLEVGDPGLGRDGVAGKVDEAAGDPGAVVLGVEHRAAAHQGEVLLAGLADPLAVLEQLGVEVVDHDLRPPMPPCSLHQAAKATAAVVHLLGEAGALGRALVGDGAEVDLVRGQAGLRGGAGLAVVADVLQVAEAALVEPAAPAAVAAGRRLRRRPRGAPAAAPISVSFGPRARRCHERHDGQCRDGAASSSHGPLHRRTAPRAELQIAARPAG